MDYGIDAWHSESMQRLSSYWDDPWARAYAISSSGSTRFARRKAFHDPFVFTVGHGPDVQECGKFEFGPGDISPEAHVMFVAALYNGGMRDREKCVSWATE